MYRHNPYSQLPQYSSLERWVSGQMYGAGAMGLSFGDILDGISEVATVVRDVAAVAAPVVGAIYPPAGGVVAAVGAGAGIVAEVTDTGTGEVEAVGTGAITETGEKIVNVFESPQQGIIIPNFKEWPFIYWAVEVNPYVRQKYSLQNKGPYSAIERELRQKVKQKAEEYWGSPMPMFDADHLVVLKPTKTAKIAIGYTTPKGEFFAFNQEAAVYYVKSIAERNLEMLNAVKEAQRKDPNARLIFTYDHPEGEVTLIPKSVSPADTLKITKGNGASNGGTNFGNLALIGGLAGLGYMLLK